MENVNVYNNGRGWRISFPLGRVIQVLMVDEARELRDVLESAIEYTEAASQPGGEDGRAGPCANGEHGEGYCRDEDGSVSFR